jgi:hypothetical protein
MFYENFYLQNQVIFGNSGFEVLKSLSLKTVGDIKNFIAQKAAPQLREIKIRKLNSEIKSFNCKIKQFLGSLLVDKEGNTVEEVSFRTYNPLTGEVGQITQENDYALLYFGIFPFELMSIADIQKLKSKKWERLKGTTSLYSFLSHTL